MDCTICYETYNDLDSIIWLSCSHSLCKNCYDKLLQLLCPFCRSPFTDERNIRFSPITNTTTNIQSPSDIEHRSWRTIADVEIFNNPFTTSEIILPQPFVRRRRQRNITRRRSQSIELLPSDVTASTNNHLSMLSASAPTVLNDIEYDYEIWEEIQIRRENRIRRRFRNTRSRLAQLQRRLQSGQAGRVLNSLATHGTNDFHQEERNTNVVQILVDDEDGIFLLDEELNRLDINRSTDDSSRQTVKNNRSNRWNNLNNQRPRYLRR
jgi:hypothetical protein